MNLRSGRDSAVIWNTNSLEKSNGEGTCLRRFDEGGW